MIVSLIIAVLSGVFQAVEPEPNVVNRMRRFNGPNSQCYIVICVDG